MYLSLNFFDPSFWTKIKSFRCDILVVSSLNDTFRSRLVDLWDKREKEYTFSFNGVTSKWRWLLSLLHRENHSVPLWCSAVYVLSCSSLLRFFFQYFVNFISQCFFFQSIIGVKKVSPSLGSCELPFLIQLNDSRFFNYSMYTYYWIALCNNKERTVVFIYSVRGGFQCYSLSKSIN